ncbi:DUF4276 family protein [Archangium sp.]|jgi:hypothetical protein|uniref:DUF4276 family protein n=1 Tax=Archangium sp. TaxID=1872627 RepID=UPI002EDA715F
MKRVLILVEGQTEEAFVQKVLAPHLLALNVVLTPTILVTKWVKSGGHFKGGATSYAKVKRDLKRLLTNAECITTMLDYYGLPDDFPGLTDRPTGNCYQRVEHVERAFQTDIAHPRFLPYLALHEFEALLFTEPARCTSVFFDVPGAIESMQAIRAGVASPEEINEGPTTAPSKRIQKVFPGYQKTLHGPLATIEYGLAPLRAACPHFHKWVSALEAL